MQFQFFSFLYAKIFSLNQLIYRNIRLQVTCKLRYLHFHTVMTPSFSTQISLLSHLPKVMHHSNKCIIRIQIRWNRISIKNLNWTPLTISGIPPSMAIVSWTLLAPLWSKISPSSLSSTIPSVVTPGIDTTMIEMIISNKSFQL